MNRSTVLALTVIGIVATLTTIWLSGVDDGKVRPALAGPCGADPQLVFQDDPNNPLQFLALFGTQGKEYADDLRVETLPDQLPPGKPPVTIAAFDVDGDDGIHISFDPVDSDGSFDTKIFVEIDSDVPPGVYNYDIVLVCHEQETHIPFSVYVESCPAPSAAFRASGNGTPTAEPFPSSCATPSPSPGSPTPTGSATPTPVGSPTPSPTAAPGGLRGDVDCNGSVNSVDALKELRFVAQLPVAQNQPCRIIGSVGQQFSGGAEGTPFGDVDCSNSVNSVDALKILRYVAQLPVSQNEPCTDIGEPN